MDVVIDPGHGGSTYLGGSSPNNAIGPAGTLEKTLNLVVALSLAGELGRHGLSCLLTRNADYNLSLRDRARRAAESGVRVFVSIHFNGYNGAAQGTETYVHLSSSEESARLASCVQNHLLQATQLTDRGVKMKSLDVLRPGHHGTGTAACLAEISFMDVAGEEIRLQDPDYIHRIADELGAGIVEFGSHQTWGTRRYTPIREEESTWRRILRWRDLDI